MARDEHLTLNTIVQGAWALLLRTYTGRDEVLFGSTVAGRPPALAGVESIVGLFINTLPLRARVHGDASVLSVLRAIQRQQAEHADYAYARLVDIQQCSAIPTGSALFDTLVVFENYPFDPAVKARLAECVTELGAIERSPYPLTLIVTLGETLSLCFKYDAQRFDGSRIDGLAAYLSALLGAIAADSHQPVALLDMVLHAESESGRARAQLRDVDEAEQFYF